MSYTNLRSAFDSFFNQEEGKRYVRQVLDGKKYIRINLDEIDSDVAHDFINKAVKFGIREITEALDDAVRVMNGSMDNVEVGFVGECIPLVKGHEIGSEHIGKLIRVKGIVNQTHFIKPMAIEVVFKCRECGAITQGIIQESPFILSSPPRKCEGCDERVSYDIVEEMSTYIDSQEFTLQESYEDISGRVPQRIKMITFKKHLINKVYCGDSVEIFGIVKVIPTYRERKKSRLNITYIDIYALKKYSRDPETMEISLEEEQEIISLSKEPDIYERLIENLAPSIYGWKKCKEGCLLAMVGGMTKHKKDITIRGNMNILMVGDPSTSKTQLLKTIADLSPRGMYCTGQGISGVGLTAALTKDSDGEWVLNAGVLVLADKGVACVDEMDKMRPEDRVNIHEAMEQQCYDDQTEILTEDGWKLFKDLKKNEKVASLNESGYLYFTLPTKYIDEKYRGNLFKIKSRQIDLAVTPNHNVYVNIRRHHSDIDMWDGFKLIEARDLPNGRMRFKKNARWKGKYIKEYIIPSVTKYINQYKSFITPEIRIKMNDWLEFLGYYISEGSIQKGSNGVPYSVYLTQSQSINPKVFEKMKSCLKRMGFSPAVSGDSIRVYSKQLAMYLDQYGHAKDKFIPKEIKQLSAKQLKILLNSLIDGDGYTDKITSHQVYITSSKRLADDVQEICLKVGVSANIPNVRLLRKRGSHVTFSKNGNSRIITTSNDIYELSIIRKKSCLPNINYDKKYKHIYKTDYSGRIYCVEVPNHLLYVRRNGKPIWCGNTVTISKGGLHSTLMARTAVIGAANPAFGKYDKTKSVFENLSKFPPTLFSRFDLIFILIDEPKKDMEDEKVLERIESEEPQIEMINRDLFKKYIAYAKGVKTKLSVEAKEELKKFFLGVRKQTRKNGDADRIPITFRQYEALIRLCEAHARILLKKEADLEDAKATIRIFSEFLEDINFDFEGMETGKPKSQLDIEKVIYGIVKQHQEIYGISHNDVINKAKLIIKDEKKIVKTIANLLNAGQIMVQRYDDRGEPCYRTAS